jgi:hypothetical protein
MICKGSSSGFSMEKNEKDICRLCSRWRLEFCIYIIETKIFLELRILIWDFRFIFGWLMGTLFDPNPHFPSSKKKGSNKVNNELATACIFFRIHQGNVLSCLFNLFNFKRHLAMREKKLWSRIRYKFNFGSFWDLFFGMRKAWLYF